MDWDVLWAHDYPFVTLREHLAHLKPHQRVRIVVNFECITLFCLLDFKLIAVLILCLNFQFKSEIYFC